MANLQLMRNLLNYREAHNYTQEKVSKYLNISRQAYSNYETGKRNPDIDLLIKLAKLYNITLDQLIMRPHNSTLEIHESHSYYKIATTKANNTLFLSQKDTDVILKYREADSHTRELVNRILDL